jgi:uncharacterized protein
MSRLIERIRRVLDEEQAETRSDPGLQRKQRLAELRRAIQRVETRTRPVEKKRVQPIQRFALPKADLEGHVCLAARDLQSDDELGIRYPSVYAPEHAFGTTQLPLPTSPFLNAATRFMRLQDDTCFNAEPALRAHEIAFIDTETTGLSRAAGTLAFLVGIGRYDAKGDGTFHVTQLLLRDPSVETHLLRELARQLEGVRLLVSFNGRGFDIPLLRNRALLSRTPLSLNLPHLDLLPHSRRIMRHRLDNCRLGTLERNLLGFERIGDIDGAEAPQIYSEFLRHGRWNRLSQIMKHNRLDILLMAPLLGEMLNRVLEPLKFAEDAEELRASGVYLLKCGQWLMGESCLRRAADMPSNPVTKSRTLTALARHLRRRGDTKAASSVWRRFRDEFPGENTGYEELAKYHEHITGELSEALAWAESAPDSDQVAIQHRLIRLRRRIRRNVQPMAQ